ncbi:hypothetical protein [Acidovorax sp. Root217]|nr:hypothetical protein [Acidovorax sp. Root217]
MQYAICRKFFFNPSIHRKIQKELLRPAAHTLDIKALLPERTN